MAFAVNLFQVHDRMGHFSRTVNTTIVTFVPTGNVTWHDGLEDTRKGSHADTRGNQYRVGSV